MIEFFKYQGTGNDFIIIDNRQLSFDSSNVKLVSFLCDRRFGIGGDGLMLLENHSKHDFTMRYFNSDGNEASMCGNGGRCIAAFAVEQGIISTPDNFSFMAVDGIHHAAYDNGIVSLKMIDVTTVDIQDNYTFLDTGSPHYVTFTNTINAINIVEEGKAIRYSDTFKPDGTNVNFVQLHEGNNISVRTYERGVEDETFSCGTGVVASAISAHLKKPDLSDFNINIKGGALRVHFTIEEPLIFKDIWLVGAATFVFKGQIQNPST